MNIVYKITNKINNKIYIGVTTNKLNERWNAHKGYARKKTQRPLYKAINKYGKKNFIIEQIDTAANEKELSEKERFYIKQYNSFVGWPNHWGYNCTEGGQDFFKFSKEECLKRSLRQTGKKMSKETRRKISETKRNNPWIPTEEYREKQRILSTGRIPSRETTAKIVAKTTGKKRTPEQKERMRQAALGRVRSNSAREKTSQSLKQKHLNKLRPFKLFIDEQLMGTFLKQSDFCKPNNIVKYTYLNNVINGKIKSYNKNIRVEFLDVTINEFLENNTPTEITYT